MMKWRGNEVSARMVRAGMKALVEGAEHILTETIDDTPIRKGTLRRSGTVTEGGLPDPQSVFEKAAAGTTTQTHRRGDDHEVYISFNTPYARRQHEERNWDHPNGGKAKYLEDQFRKQGPKVMQRVRRKMSDELNRG